MDASAGLTPEIAKEGGVRFEDAGGRVRIAFAAPFMVDAAGTRSTKVAYTLKRAGNGWMLALTAEDAWLDAEARKYPVKVDPTVYSPGGVDRDCLLATGAPTGTSLCGSTLGVPPTFL